MTYSIRIVTAVTLWLWAALAVAAPTVVPSPPTIEAHAYILQDFHSGRVLAQDNADERMEPASLTKMMTVYVVFSELRDGKISLDDKVRVSKKAWRMPGSRMFIEVGSQVSVEDLLKGVIVQSGNDASVALAEHVAGTEDAFVQLMNQYAQRLGMTHTHFEDASGLPHADHYTTAHDMAILARALIRDFPEHYKWHAIRQYTYNDITQHNRNLLLWQDDSVDGIKTGHTESAGYCLVASAEREGMRLISVVMGASSEKGRARQSEALLDYGFRFFETHRLYAADKPLTDVRVWKGEPSSLGVGLAHDLYVTVPRGEYERLNASMQLDGAVMAPVARGERHGTVTVSLGDKTLTERPLIALESVPEGGLWQRLTDEVRLLFH